ncbi:glutathione peroxidase [Chlorella sorokiniana]|uniref:Glutathione peroxidase n=1 Tax=Chlorella sorokiniana TaxID=3076 RepID=A0A2P6U382_CHLSO|nr:glutathione peroxidase [Chlorella sorokiniana]|eukprot:PRW60772.1 glutathione peroxidase [Chlorella sorokiniana]
MPALRHHLVPVAALLLLVGVLGAPAAGPSLFDQNFTATDIGGSPRQLSDYRGKVLLVVNVASKCGFTDSNYQGLQQLYSKYREQGLEVLAFPCNQFGQQEPGSNAEIAQFAKSQYGASFPLFAKVDVNGAGAAPLFSWLKANTLGEDAKRDLGWNFVKFLLDRNGRPFKRYAWDFAPALEADVQRLLAEPASEESEL